MKIALLTIFLFLFQWGNSQIVYSETSIDFEEITKAEQRIVDIYLKNTSLEDVYLLSVNAPIEVNSMQKNDLMQPDSSAVIRFYVRKRTKGKFEYEIPVYTSDSKSPTIIKLKGKVGITVAENNLSACPTFGEKPSEGNPLDFTLCVETIDKETRKPISKSKVAILQNGSAIGKWNTNKNGQLKVKIPLGISYFYATSEGYYPSEKAEYVNYKNNTIVLALVPKEKLAKENERVAENTPIQEKKEVREIVIEEDIKVKQPQKQVEIFESTREEKKVEPKENFAPNETIPDFDELDKENFDAKYFQAVNVVFVIDVSYSMNRYDRAELLKYSLNQLLEMLRPEDQIGLVSYATNAEILMSSTSENQKEEISKMVEKLKISGNTAGGKGIKLGYKEVKRSLIKDGKNHLIIITDGAFNKGSDKYKKYIKRNLRRNDITMSVVGIKSKERARKSMKEVAKLGNGRFLHIEKLIDAQNKLKQEIRFSAFKHH